MLTEPLATRATVGGPGRRAQPKRSTLAHVGALWVIAFAALAPAPARALDGCLVLLCLAAPSWSAIAQCVQPVRQLFRNLARGRPFPSCAMSGAGNLAANHWANAPAFCPPQYTRLLETENGPTYACDYGGCVSVSINGNLFARTWWNFGGDTATEFTPYAKQQLGTWDTRFDNDYARWLTQQPPASADPSLGQ